MESEESAVRSCPLCQLTFPTGYPDDALIKHIDSHLENSKIWTIGIVETFYTWRRGSDPGCRERSVSLHAWVGRTFPELSTEARCDFGSSRLEPFIISSLRCLFFLSLVVEGHVSHTDCSVLNGKIDGKAAFVHKRQSCLERNVKWKQKYRYIYIY